VLGRVERKEEWANKKVGGEKKGGTRHPRGARRENIRTSTEQQALKPGEGGRGVKGETKETDFTPKKKRGGREGGERHLAKLTKKKTKKIHLREPFVVQKEKLSDHAAKPKHRVQNGRRDEE